MKVVYAVWSFIMLQQTNHVVPENTHTYQKDSYWKLREGGVSKAKILKGSYEVKLKIQEGWEGLNRRTILGGGMGIFWNHTCTFSETFSAIVVLTAKLRKL